MHRYYFHQDEEDSEQEVYAQTAVSLAMIQNGEPVIALSPEMIILAWRVNIMMLNLQDTDGEPFVLDEHYDPLLSKFASFLLNLNKEGVELFRELNEEQKAEARRVFQACLEVIDT